MMTTLKTVAIAAVLLVGGASLAMAQNGPATGGQLPVAGGAGGGWFGQGYAAAPLYDYAAPTYGYAAPVADLAPPAYGVCDENGLAVFELIRRDGAGERALRVRFA
jgi:hypothetical protein